LAFLLSMWAPIPTVKTAAWMDRGGEEMNERRKHRSNAEIETKELMGRSRAGVLREIERLTAERRAAPFTISHADGPIKPGYKGEDLSKFGGDSGADSGGDTGADTGAEPADAPTPALPYVCKGCKGVIAKGAPNCPGCGVQLAWESVT